MKISALTENGQIKEYDVILTYHSEVYNKHYIVYTENKYDEKHELRIYVSEYDYDNPENIVTDITNKEEYNEVKKEIDKILLNIKKETEKL